ncbi:MAG: glycosyltransferase family 39 protein [Thermoleophilaceae bacterium]|nr:glycosyltransferase family 39 protein [Thermoleophilaceae bacterium]
MLRLPGLAGQSYGHDETYTLGVLGGGFEQVLQTVPQSERTPFLYYVVGWGWAQLFGTGEAGLRSLSVLCGVVTILAVYAAATRLFDRPAALLAGALVAVNPLLIWYSQEARAYALVILLLALSLLGLALIRSGRRGSGSALWAISAALAIATHYFAFFPVAVEAILLLRSAGVSKGKVVAAIALPLATLVALVPLLVGQASRHPGDVASPATLLKLGGIPKQFILGEWAPANSGAAISILLLGGLASIFWLAWRSSETATRSTVLACAAIALAAPLAALAGLVLGFDYLVARNLAVGAPAALAALGGLLSGARSGIARAGAVGLLVACLAGSLWAIADPRMQRDDWRAIAGVLPSSGCHAVLVYPIKDARPLAAYASGLSIVAVEQAGAGEVVQIWTTRERPAPPRLEGLEPISERSGPTYGLRFYRVADDLADRARDGARTSGTTPLYEC